jgi:MFS family permease
MGATASLTAEEIIYSLKISIADGFFATAFVTLTGTVFLPAFLLAIGANSFQIGAIAALPFFGNMAQLLGAFIVEKWNVRKPLVVYASGLGRFAWLPAIIVFMLTLPENSSAVIGGVFFLIISAHSLLAISGVAWLSWMATTVPEAIRGRYYGMRNALIGIGTILITMASGYFLDWVSGGLRGFYVIFGVAVLLGGISTHLLSKQKEAVRTTATRFAKGMAARSFLQPLRDANFRRLLLFGMVWTFAVNASSPFYVVYVLHTLSLPYSFAASFAVLAAVGDFIGMRVWGAVSDRAGNKPVIVLAAVCAAPVPLLMLPVVHSAASIFVLLPLVYFAGGFFLAGYNLCTANILFRLAPRKRDTIFFAWWAALTGLASGCGAIFGGVLTELADALRFDAGIFSLDGLKTVFAISGLFRFMAVPLLRGLREPGIARTSHALKAILSWRGDRTGVLNLPVRIERADERGAQENEFWPLFRRAKG